MKKRKLTRKNLDELVKVMPVLSENVQKTFIGGSSGSQSNPYSEAEYERRLASGTWNGGFVENWGYISSIGDIVISGNNVQNRFNYIDARHHYQNGNGSRVDIWLENLNLDNVRMSDFINGRANIRLLGKHFSSMSDGLIHGTITLVLIPGTNRARVAPNSDFNGEPVGMYDFEMHPWTGNIARNIGTIIGEIVSGSNPVHNLVAPGIAGSYEYAGGTPFPIYYHGTVTIQN